MARQPPPGRNAGWPAAAGFPVIPTHKNRASLWHPDRAGSLERRPRCLNARRILSPVQSPCDVFQIVLNTLWVLHTGSACASTRSRNFSGRNPGARTDTRTRSNSCAARSSLTSVNRVVFSVASTSKSSWLSSVSARLRTDPRRADASGRGGSVSQRSRGWPAFGHDGFVRFDQSKSRALGINVQNHDRLAGRL